MFPQSEREVFGGSERSERFDADSGRRLLEQAAAEQYRLRKELDESYSIEELEEMATEAGISPQALRSVLKRRSAGDATSRGWLPERWLRAKWAPVLAGVTVVALLGLMLVSPTVAYFMLGIAIALGVLVLLGVSPM